MKTRSEIKEIVTNTLIQVLGVDEIEVTEDSSLQNDLGADSLDAVELTINFEQEFNICITDDDVQIISTVKDIIDYFIKRQV